MAPRSPGTPSADELFRLEELAALPCGCVVSTVRAPLLNLTVVRLEAKGPYCVLPGHQVGGFLRPGSPGAGDGGDRGEEEEGGEEDDDRL